MGITGFPINFCCKLKNSTSNSLQLRIANALHARTTFVNLAASLIPEASTVYAPACAQTASYPRNATEDGKLSHSGGYVKLSGDGQAFFWSPTKK